MEHYCSNDLYFCNYKSQNQYSVPYAYDQQVLSSRMLEYNNMFSKHDNNFVTSQNSFVMIPEKKITNDYNRRGSVTLLKESFLNWNPTVQVPSAADTRILFTEPTQPALPEERSYVATTLVSFSSFQRELAGREEYEKNLLSIEEASKKKKYTHRMSKQASQALEAWLLETLNQPELILTPETRRLFQQKFNLSGKQLTNWLYYAHKKRERLLKERKNH